MRALLIVTCRTIVNALDENHPCILNSRIFYAIAGLHIFFYPTLLGKLLWAPRQLTHQLKHHRIILRTLHREAYAFTVFLVCIEIIEQLIHTTMKTDISSKVL